MTNHSGWLLSRAYVHQRRGLVAQNVAREVSIKMSGRHKHRAEIGIDVPRKDEAKKLVANLLPGRWRPLIITAMFTGLRASELRGLTWGNIDLEEKVLRVRQRADRWQNIGPLKSASSRRDIPMAPLVVNTMREWKLTYPRPIIGRDQKGHPILEEHRGAHLVFPTGVGKVESLANIYNRGFTPLQVRAGIVRGPKLDRHGKQALDEEGKPIMLPKYGLHALRHFFASWLIDQGFGPKRIQALLGHSGIQITFDTYGHLFPQEDDHDRFAAGELALVG